MKRKAVWVAPLAVLAMVTWANAAIWTEQGDAGDLIGTQQTPGPPGMPLTAIVGTLATFTDVDGYSILIPDPLAFQATTLGGATWDTQLTLFD